MPEARLRALLACPSCYGRLEWAVDVARCAGCGADYPVENGIPVLLGPAFSGNAPDHDELDHDGAGNHKHRQALHFDREEAADFEIRRPRGAPALHGWFLSEKFRRAVAPIRPRLPGATVLVVCGGSGMDAEFLARTGAEVITSDLSSGATRRAAERARRFGIPYVSIVADVEALPFPDESVDVVYVHDGLHHLERVEPALDEMTRVARWAVSITEPARASLTSLAVRAGVALDREPAGNRVLRLDPAELSRRLTQRGFASLTAERYAMFYRHHPGRASDVLSRPLFLPAARAWWVLANAVLGQFGNKMVVTAVRRDRAVPRTQAAGRGSAIQP